MTEVCVPVEGGTKTIEHPAVGNPTIVVENPDYVPATEGYFITIPNPDYVPATEGYFETVDNPDYVPAVEGYTETVPNPDYVPATDGYFVTAEKLWKWTWVGGPVSEAPVSPLVDPTGWNSVGFTNDSKGDGNADTVIQVGNHGKASYFFFQTIETWVEGTPAVGNPTIDRWVEGTPAIGEPTIQKWVEGTPAVGEETIQQWVEGTPAEGTETIEVENPEYIPAHTETVVTEPVECPVAPPSKDTPVVPVVPVVPVATVATPTATPASTGLAHTGGADFTGLILLTAVMLSAGTVLMRKAVKR